MAIGDLWIDGFRGHTLAFTGRVLVDGHWTIREDCVRMAMARGARDWKTDMSGRVSLLVYGDLASANVTDKTRQYSKKLKLAESLRRAGNPVIVIDGSGFSDLCEGYPARNRALKAESTQEYLVLPDVGDRVLGGPLVMRRVAVHDVNGLAIDLAALDKGTAAHEATVSALAEVLHRRGLLAEGPARFAPNFDIGWSDEGVSYIAEVKSLGGTDEAQQIRLGLGQVLDYVQQIRSLGIPQPLAPMLVLEREPHDARRWIDAAQSAGVSLVYGPTFELTSRAVVSAVPGPSSVIR